MAIKCVRIKTAKFQGRNLLTDALNWEASYAIALALHRQHPDVDLVGVSLGMVYNWVLELADFVDDPVLVNDSILMSIYQEWFEEANAL